MHRGVVGAVSEDNDVLGEPNGKTGGDDGVGWMGQVICIYPYVPLNIFYLTPASLESTENAERSPLFFIESGGTDSMKALSAVSPSRLQILYFAEDMRLMENRYLPDSP